MPFFHHNPHKTSQHLPSTASAGLIYNTVKLRVPLFRIRALGSLVDKVHELVELRSDDDLGAAVALLANFCVVRRNGVELAAASGSEAFRLHAVLVDERLYYA